MNLMPIVFVIHVSINFQLFIRNACGWYNVDFRSFDQKKNKNDYTSHRYDYIAAPSNLLIPDTTAGISGTNYGLL